MTDQLLRAKGQVRLARVRARKLAALSTAPGLWPAVREGVVPAVEHSGVPFRSDIKAVLDVGASRGQFALFAEHRFPSARIICFEPIPDAREKLRAVTGSRVEIVDAAVGAEEGTAQLNVSAKDDSSSLLGIGSRQVNEFPGTERERVIDVRVTTLASAVPTDLPGPVLLKIDVQGAELDVLRGAGAVLDRIDEAFIECSFVELYEGQALADEVISFLLSRGLRLAGIYGMSSSVTGGSLQADLHFSRGDAV